MKQLLDHNNYRTYICSYNYGGNPYSINIIAQSFEEAEQRLKSIAFNGKVDGELVLSIPVPKTNKWIKKIKSFFL